MEYFKLDSNKCNDRILRAAEIANLIISKDYRKAADLIRPAGSIASSTDNYPEAVARYFSDCQIENPGILIAAIEDVIMGNYPRTTIPDAASIGYEVTFEDLQRASIGIHAYANALSSARWNGKYKLNTSRCDCCKQLDGNIYALEQAKVGSTLPPFSDSCMGEVYSIFR